MAQDTDTFLVLATPQILTRKLDTACGRQSWVLFDAVECHGMPWNAMVIEKGLLAIVGIRKWCVGEMVTARASKVYSTLLCWPDFELPNDDYIACFSSIAPHLAAKRL